MKLGSLMDPREARRGLRGHAFIFDPAKGAIPVDDEPEAEAVVGDDGPAPINYDEPEPDDPDA